MTDSGERKPVPEFDAAPSKAHHTTPETLNQQRLRLTAARDRINHAAQLLADGDRDQLCACAELRLAVRALQQDQQADE